MFVEYGRRIRRETRSFGDPNGDRLHLGLADASTARDLEQRAPLAWAEHRDTGDGPRRVGEDALQNAQVVSGETLDCGCGEAIGAVFETNALPELGIQNQDAQIELRGAAADHERLHPEAGVVQIR